MSDMKMLPMREKWVGYRKPNSNLIPPDWTAVRIRDVASFKAGGSLGLTMADYKPEGTPAYTAEGQNGFAAVTEFDTKAVIVSSIGALCGKSFYSDGPFTTLANIQVIFGDEEKVSNYFLWSLLNDRAYWAPYQTAQPFIRPSDIQKSWIPKPATRGEQTRIAETLKAADDHIRALEDQIRKAERMKKALMQSAFPYERDSTGLPTINSLIVAPVTNGYSPVCPDYDTGRWVLGLDALSEHGFNPEGKKPAPADDPKLAGNELLVNDILISRSNTRERVGFAGLYDGDPAPCFYPDLMMRVRVDHAKIRPRYLDLLLQSEFARRYFQSRAGGTSGSMVKIKERDVRQMPVILPDPDEQDIVVERFKTGAELIAAIRTQLTAARRVKQSLLQNLLTGKIRLEA